MKELITSGHTTSDRSGLMEELNKDHTIDFDGYPITGIFYRGLEQSEASHCFCDLREKNIPVHIIALTRSTQRSVQTVRLPPNSLTVSLTDIPLFWSKLDYTDPGTLITLIAETIR